MGATTAGLVPVNTNYRYVDDELVYLWTDCAAATVIFHASFVDRIDRIRPQVPGVKLWVWVAESDVDECPDWAVPFESMAGGSSGSDHAARRSEDDVFLMYTGGTTGLPEGCGVAPGRRPPLPGDVDEWRAHGRVERGGRATD